MKRSGHRQEYLIFNFDKITHYLSKYYETIRGTVAIKKIHFRQHPAAVFNP
jgi:hypothetical protein